MQERSVTLYCTEGGSDKVYKTDVVESGGGYVVNFWYGPRTGTLRPGTKTPNPVSKERAIQIWEKLVGSKKAKGYHEGEDAPAYTEPDGSTRDTGIRPMLLTPETEENIEKYILDDGWGGQEKLNGVRVALQVLVEAVTGINRKGLDISIPKNIEQAVRGKGSHLFDGEMKGETYHIFDLLATGPGLKRDNRCRGYADRFIQAGVAVHAIQDPSVELAPLITGERKKRALVAGLRKSKKEGVVFKRLDGKYEPGRIENLKKALQVKIKFYSSGEFVALGWNPGKQSIQIGAYDEGKHLVNVGNVTVPDKYLAQVKGAEIVRVRYLYATDGKKLYQPHLDPDESGSVVRADLERKDCVLSQLKYEGKD